MAKKHIITLSGLPGSGKSSTGRGLAAALQYEHHSSGDFMRAIGEKRGLSIDETNEAAELDPTFDAEVDNMIRETGEQKDNFIMDSRIAYHWIPDSFKVFLKIDPKIAAKRILEQIKTEGRVGETASTLEEIRPKLLARTESEKKRYMTLYQLDYTDEKQYDLVIDSGVHEFDERVKMITDAYEKWLAAPSSNP